MLVGEIGNTFKTTSKIDYHTNQALYDFDLIVVDLDSIFIKFDSTRTLPYSYLEKFQKRQAEFEEFLLIPKKYIVCFTPSNKMVLLQNQSNKVLRYNALRLLNKSETINTIGSSGKAIKVLDSPFKNFFKNYQKFFTYENYFNQSFGIPLMEIEHTEKIISVLDNKVLYVPSIINLSIDETIFFDELYNLFEGIYGNHSVSEIPNWSNKYYLPEEKKDLKLIEEIENQIELLLVNKNLHKKKVEETRLFKQLFTGTGKSLEKIVENVFIQLGFIIKKQDITNKDDLIARIGNKVLIIEVKGVAGTAALKNARQLENWLTDYEPDNEIILVKGLLVVNSFKDMFLEERVEPTFPHSMLEFSQRRQHCLITGIQLLGILIDLQKNPSYKEDIIESIFLTEGIYNRYNDWQQFLEVENNNADSQIEVTED